MILGTQATLQEKCVSAPYRVSLTRVRLVSFTSNFCASTARRAGLLLPWYRFASVAHAICVSVASTLATTAKRPLEPSVSQPSSQLQLHRWCLGSNEFYGSITLCSLSYIQKDSIQLYNL